MKKSFKAHPAVSLFLILRIVFTTMPISAAELAPAIGNIVSVGSVIVDGSPMDTGKLLDGGHIRTGDLSSAKVVLLNGNSIQLASGTDLVVTRNNEDIRLQLSSGTVSFAATDNHLAMAFGQYEIAPESGASGSVTIKDGGFADVRLETGSATLQNADEGKDILLSGVSERTLTLKSISSSESPLQLASNLPSPEPNAPAQSSTIPNTQQAPEITSVNPSSLKPGTEPIKVTITGRYMNFFSTSSVQVSGPGVTVSNLEVIDSTHMRATVVLTNEATPGPRTLTVTTGDGTATSSININAAAPGAAGGSSGGAQGGSHTKLIIAGVAGAGGVAAAVLALNGNKSQSQGNHPPVAVPDSFTTNVNTTLTVPAPGVLANDTDADGDVRTAVLNGTVSHGTLSLAANGSFTYTPALNFNGTDSFTYHANDGKSDSTLTTVTITVGAVNHAPVANNDSYTIPKNTVLNMVPVATGVLANDTDPDGDTLTAVLNTNVQHGTLTLNANGSFSYNPALNYTGPDSFTYHANDGKLDSNVATASITVSSGNVPPVLTAGGTLNYTENAAAAAIDNTITVSDADSANLASATAQITTNCVNSQDELSFTNQNGITGSYANGSCLMTLTGSSSLANYQAALRSVKYNNTSANPSTATRTVTWTGNDGSAASTGVNSTINVVAVNSPPVLTAGATLSYTEGAAPATIDNTITVNDVDSANLASATAQITTNCVNSQDTLSFTNQNGITGSYANGSCLMTLTGSSSVANYQAALRSVKYNNTSVNPSTAARTVTWTGNDGAAASTGVNSTINVVAVNSPPVLTAGGTLSYTVNAAATVIDNTITVNDVDSANLASATVQITTNCDNPRDVLSFATQNGIGGSYSQGNCLLTLTGSSSLANYQAALRSVKYNNAAANMSTAARTVTWIGTDSSNAASTAVTSTINIVVPDSPPVLTAGKTLSYTEGAAATVIDNSITVADADNTTLASATAQITSNCDSSQDVLSFTNQNGITGAYTAASCLMTLTGSASLANYQSALRSVKYNNTSGNPSTAARTVTWIGNDGTAASAAVTSTINVTAVNDAPVLTAGGTLGYIRGAAATPIDTTVTVSDVDSVNLASATAQITTNCQSAQDVLSFTNQNGITGSYTASNCRMALTGSSSLANYQTALRSVKYNNTAATPNTTTRTVTWIGNDGALASTAVTSTITVSLTGSQVMSLDVTKDVSQPVVAPGDPVVFSLGIVNTSPTATLTTASLNDTLPAGFSFSAGSATIQYLGMSGDATAAQTITPSETSGGLVFPIGTLGAGDRASIVYSAVVNSDAHPGEAKSSVVGIVNLLSGKQSTSNSAQVSVTVTKGGFTLNQVLIGRVFEDRNRNGKYDSGEPGISNIRVVTSSGQTSTTDSDGQYSLPSLSPGSVLVALDPATLPPGYELPPNETRLGGAGQILQTPLGGGGLLRQNFGLIRTGALTSSASSAPASTISRDEGIGGDGPRLEMAVERPIMKAGAYDRQLIRIRAFDKAGQSLDTPIVVKTETGAVMVAAKISDQYACESVLSLEQRPDRTRQVELETNSGEAAICLISDVVPGTTRLTASVTSDETLSASASVRFETEQRSPLLVAIGEVGIGLSGPGKNATDGARRVDGQTSIFYQNSLSRNDLFTVAVRTKGSVNSATGADGLFEFDPTQRIYPVMGDASTRQELGQSSGHVYVRYDRGHSYMMYGDLHGDTAAEGHSTLLEYNRNVTGLRFHLQGPNPANWVQGQVAHPKTAYKRDITTALMGSAFRLSESQIVRGSETITFEVRDRRNPERIISRENLVRNVDYWLDQQSGVVFMMRPFPMFDSSLNIVQLVTTYEFQATGIQSTTFLGRGSYSFSSVGLRLGASALSQSEGGDKFSVAGLELEQKLFNGGHFKAELPVSNGRLLMDPNSTTSMASTFGETSVQNGKAIRAEFDQPLGVRSTVLRGRFAKTDPGFFNPYGAIAVAGQMSRGISMETRGIQSGKIRLGFEQEVNQNQAVDNQRQTLSASMTQTLTETLSAEAGFDHRNFEDRKSADHIDSNLITAGLKWKPLSRLETYIRREQNLGEADPTYPTQTLLGAQYNLTSTNRIFATQRISSSPITPIDGAETSGVLVPQSTKETAIGMESRLRQNTSLTTNYTMDSSLSGPDSFAVLRLLTRVPIRSGLSFDWSLDNAMHLAGTGKGYVGGSLGFTETRDDKLRMSVRYELRRRDTTETILTAGVVGRLNAATSALVRYRTAENQVTGIGRINDGQMALSVRPKKSDRVAMLFSYDFGNGNSFAPLSNSMGTNASTVSNTGAVPSPAVVNLARTDRLSMDGLIEIHHGFEFYSRAAAARTPGIYGGSRVGTYLQGRLQKSLTRRFDIAGEARWVQESRIARGALITGLEWGTWLNRDLRIGLGYSPSGFANPGALLNSTAARGGLYMVISSRLSGIFDLMGGSEKSKSATSVAAKSESK
jgi:VCBS repeat-containing protein